MATQLQEKVKMNKHVEGILAPMFAPMFEDEFLDLLTMKLESKLKHELIEDDPHVYHVLETLMIIMRQRLFLCANDKVSWYFNQEIAELVSEASKEINWESDLVRAAEAL